MAVRNVRALTISTLLCVFACSGFVWAATDWRLGLATLFAWFALSGSLDLSNG